jgi:hypothetical protein
MLTFRHALEAANIDPSATCVLRHVDAKADPGRNPYQLFLNDRSAFEAYQSLQSPDNRPRLKAAYWASFVGTPGRGTMFCGLYACRYLGVGDKDIPMPHRKDIDRWFSIPFGFLSNLTALRSAPASNPVSLYECREAPQVSYHSRHIGRFCKIFSRSTNARTSFSDKSMYSCRKKVDIKQIERVVRKYPRPCSSAADLKLEGHNPRSPAQ